MSYQSHQYLTGGFFIVVSFRITETGMYQMEITTGVSYTTSAWNGLLVPAVAGQGFPVSVGGNRRAGESAVWAADILTNPYFKIKEDRKAGAGE